MDRFVLYGAGAAGRYTLKHLASKGNNQVVFADTDPSKWGKSINDAPVMSPTAAKILCPDATWVATCISAPARGIRAGIQAMGVKTVPLYEVLECFHGLPPEGAATTVSRLLGDMESGTAFFDQIAFRCNQDYDAQPLPSDCRDIYFPEFIKHRDDERFIDCGAADGDTVKAFMERWEKWDSIIAFEPDRSNYAKLCLITDPEGRGRITELGFAVSDFDGDTTFVASGDYSSHLGDGQNKVRVTTLDQMCGKTSPTYIKMDIEGAELEALWGARRILREHAPVLAICAYHTSDHLWQIPLLIHALNPDYKLYLRRYAEGAWELVWYAVPPDRFVVPVPANHESYSDNHTG